MSTLAPGQRFDLLVFGATGYTGQYVVEEVARVAARQQEKKIPLSWAIAGRSKDKLDNVLAVAMKETGLSMDGVGVVLADVKDQESIDAMAAQANVVVNCVGPYSRWGEGVVKACIQQGASHVDISGEPHFMELMQLKYHTEAEQKGVSIVSACGFDSVPADIGILHMVRSFDGELNSVEQFGRANGGPGTSIHTGTMESAALVAANRDEIARIRKELFSPRLPKPDCRVVKKGAIHKNDDLGLWGFYFPSDEPVVYRTQYYRHTVLGQRALQFQQFFATRSLAQALGMMLGVGYFFLLAAFSFTRNLLFKYPEVMTAGVFTRAGAPREALKKGWFSTVLVGKGWAKGEDASGSPKGAIKVKVSGPDPGYVGTAAMMVSCALTLINDANNCRRGVVTPYVAFENTCIVENLREAGIGLEVMENSSSPQAKL